MCLLFCLFCCFFILFFLFNDTATTEIYTLSLHDALPISMHLELMESDNHVTVRAEVPGFSAKELEINVEPRRLTISGKQVPRSEEHTSELQSLRHLVCRLLLEKKKKNTHQ